LITLTGLDFNTFDWLLEKFQEIHDNYSPFVDPHGRIVPRSNPQKGGRPRLVTAFDCLGLCLAWTRTRGSNMVLQIIFGMTSSPVSMYLRFGRRILIHLLNAEPDAAVKAPSVATIGVYKDCIRRKYPLLEDVWCTMDGLKLCLQQSGDVVLQNMFYNGWTHDHYVSSVLVFCPDGTIPMCCLNAPGCMHDSAIAESGRLYHKLENIYNTTGGKCAVDSAFSNKRAPFLIKSSQMPPGGETRAQYRNNNEINKQATSLRQSAEWGMRALQSSFPRLKDRFVFEKFGERRLILKMMVLIYNLRARRVGINQIRNTFLPALNVNANAAYL
jgi:hypothetical protein